MENRNYRITFAGHRKIEMGDRIFVRMTMGSKTVVEFMSDRVADMTGLIGELRLMTYGLRGLCNLYVRNQSRGWSIERPLMLYAPSLPSQPRGSKGMSAEMFPEMQSVSGHMPFPWETH